MSVCYLIYFPYYINYTADDKYTYALNNIERYVSRETGL